MRKICYLLPAALLMLNACVSTPDVTPTSYATPTGTFVGQFRKIHKTPATNKLDTATINLTLTLSTTTGYAVTGDTTKLHAGSNGAWGLNASYLNFIDATLPKTGTPAKIHLNGTYPYAFDGSKLQFYVNFADTMAFQYDLKKN